VDNSITDQKKTVVVTWNNNGKKKLVARYLEASKAYFNQPHVLRHLSITIDAARVNCKSQMFGSVGSHEGVAAWMVNTATTSDHNRSLILTFQHVHFHGFSILVS
jgi:hypothetical protein